MAEIWPWPTTRPCGCRLTRPKPATRTRGRAWPSSPPSSCSAFGFGPRRSPRPPDAAAGLPIDRAPVGLPVQVELEDGGARPPALHGGRRLLLRALRRLVGGRRRRGPADLLRAGAAVGPPLPTAAAARSGRVSPRNDAHRNLER